MSDRSENGENKPPTHAPQRRMKSTREAGPLGAPLGQISRAEMVSFGCPPPVARRYAERARPPRPRRRPAGARRSVVSWLQPPSSVFDMDLSQTRQLARLMNAHHRNKEARFAVGPDQARRGRLEGFHPWVEGRAVFGAWRVAAPSGRSLELLLIDWAEKETGYLVVYPANRTGPILEAHRIEETRRRSHLCWRYTPFKRDGRNAERTALYEREYGDRVTRTPLPRSTADVERFLRWVFETIERRSNADALRRVPESHRGKDAGHREARLKERLHLQRERSPTVVKKAKTKALRERGCLRCEVCGFDFVRVYGDLGDGFIEAHHIVPLSKLAPNSRTRVEDLALVCANCHRMLHRAPNAYDRKSLHRILADRKSRMRG